MPSTPDFERDLGRIEEDLKHAKQRGAVVLIGAGCSKSAGVPLARGFCDLIEQEFEQTYADAKRRGGTGYQALMAELSGDQRMDLLKKVIDKATLNWAHIALAGLIEKGFVSRVLTTNFDPLVVRACALLNVFPAVYDLAASTRFDPYRVSSPAVLYLHGQMGGFRLLNTQGECDSHVENLGPVFDEAGQGRPWIVVGYSGENDPVFERLLAGRTYGSNLYWISHRNDDPGEHLTRRLLSRERSAYFVRGYDADTFFLRLASGLGCFPPALVNEPFTHLQDTFDRIVSESPEGHEAQTGGILDQAREKVRKAAERDDATAEANMTTRLRLALAAGDYAQVISEWKKAENPSAELNTLASRAMQGQGVDLTRRAQSERDPATARVEFEAAIERYAAAIAVEPDSHEALYNWGLALDEIAERTEDPAAVRAGFEAAAEKYAAAVAVKPEKHDALYNWGAVLLHLVARTDDPERQTTLLAEAEKVLDRAFALDPHERYNLACVYARQGRSDEARDLLNRARDAGTLPSADKLLADEDFASVRDEPWFKDLIRSLADGMDGAA